MPYRTQFALRNSTVISLHTTNVDDLLRHVDDPDSDFYRWTIVSRDSDSDAWSVDPDYNYT